MRVCVYSPFREIADLLVDHLRENNHICISPQTLAEVFLLIQNQKEKPDLMILDYISFNHDTFNIIGNLNKKNLFLPFIFFNDPCLTRSTRTAHWKNVIDSLSPEMFNKDLNKYDDIFNDIQQFIEDPKISPYIPLMQKREELPSSMIKPIFTSEYIKANIDDGIGDFQNRVNLSNSLLYLLKIFRKNKNKKITLKDILEVYKNDNKQMTENSLKVLISKLRNLIRKDKQCHFLIYQEDKEYQFIVYK